MKQKTTGKIKFGVWGLVIGAVITMLIGFSWGGWTTFEKAKSKTDKIILERQAAICIAQFKAHPEYEEKLKEMGYIDSWKRSQFIEKGGWDKMPGQEKADYGVSRVCAEGLNHLVKSTR